jgi:Tfp pilus assembly protein PilF
MTSLRFVALALLALGLTACPSTARQEKAQARVVLGSAYLVEGATEQAISTLQEATKLDRRNIDAWNQLGMAMMKRGEFELGEDAFKKGLRLNKENASINLNYSYFLIRTERWEEAVVHLEAGLKDLTFREPAKILNNLGYAYYAQGRFGSAERRLKEAVIRAPHYCQAWFNLGLTCEALNRSTDAIDAYDHVVMICPGDAAGSYQRSGVLFLASGRMEEGVHYLNRVCEDWPGSDLCKQARTALAGVETE